jgi:hypothetical protein
MPIVPGVIETFDNLKNLHKKKNDDYTGEKGPFFNFEFCEYFAGLFSNTRDKVYAVFVGVKLARLSVVLTRPPSNESVTDSFDDAIVYLALWKADYVSRNANKTRHDRVEAVTIRGKDIDA